MELDLQILVTILGNIVPLKPKFVKYRKVARQVSTSTSHLEAHAGLFRLLMKGIFDLYMRCDLLTKR